MVLVERSIVAISRFNPHDTIQVFAVEFQCVTMRTDISSIVTDLPPSSNRCPDRNKMPVVPGSSEHRVGAIGHVDFVVLANIVFDVHEPIAF